MHTSSLVLFFTFGCAAIAGAADAQTSMSSDARLTELRALLDRARSARENETVRSATGSESVDALVGMTRDSIHPCDRDDVRTARGGVVLLPPCRNRSDWFYSFHHLARGMRGGGAELRLSFDAQGTCTAARWAFTR